MSLTREDLFAALDDAVERCPVTLVCAPAGYGKTSLLAGWVAASGAAAAWVLADRRDDDPQRLFCAMARTIRRHCPVPRGNGLHGWSHRAGDQADTVAELLDAVGELPGRIRLVVDDVHEISDPSVWHGIETMIRYQPDNLRLVLSSRADPPLPLARLRLRGELAELRAGDLRFAEPEADALLRRAGVVLEAGRLTRLVERTAGWPAGLRMVARALQHDPDRAGFVDDFAVNDQSVAAFLMGEVLAGMPEGTAEVLRAVSVCAEVSPRVAAALSGRPDAGSVLADLEWEGAFVARVGQREPRYRVHPMWRSFLYGDVRRRRPDAVGRLHATAAAGLASEGLLPDALDEAARCDDSGFLVRLLVRYGPVLLFRGEGDAVRRALEVAERDPRARNDPRLLVVSAIADLQAGRPPADAAATASAPATGSDADGMVRTLLRSALALSRGGEPEQVPDTAGTGRPELQAWAWLNRGWIALRDGRVDAAREALRAAQRLAEEHGLPGILSHVQPARESAAWLAGDLADAAAAHEAREGSAEPGGQDVSLLLHRLTGAFFQLLRAEPDAARRSIGDAAEVDLTRHPVLAYLVEVVNGTCAMDGGKRSAGLWRLRRARTTLGTIPVPAPVAAVGALAEAGGAVLAGDESAARETADWLCERVGPSAEVALIRAWTAGVPVGVPDSGGAGSRAVLPVLTEVHGRVHDIGLALSSGRRTHAFELLHVALRTAEPVHLIRPFAVADRRIARLLVEHAGGFASLEPFGLAIRQAVFGAGRSGAGDGGVGLTARERDVLGHLSSMRSLEELAATLGVSVNTVKTHVRSVYAKLGVHTRRGALAEARQRGLVDVPAGDVRVPHPRRMRHPDPDVAHDTAEG
ncbi:LuxR family maltose regulon positive regulatory protein [Prauserella sediminis]|uniref:LuxR family maltose regulon positive regulatory protein n=1 Tax=Prauserella sediminis TaxID=577680 RepID=A0A839XNT2_9PSEU|nr:LuxR C-terminal-related transcriptional regulator [Prauserella sediminis]MBB3664890.1 LuxR family maltose regulon positive regulatory protein [Prauserella sediminis]